MLTCKVGNTIINCFDGKYDKFTLKKWSEENRLLCPDCSSLYEYCHGEIVNPYFRHKEKNKDCESIYYEPETEEHIQGKIILYNWLLKQYGLSNIKLETYIPETRQRPDLYFEVDDKRFVIEYQCSPIATEYLKRHELYQLAGINDIWILGTDKYIEKSEFDNFRGKVIEKYTNFYLDVYKNIFIFSDIDNLNIDKSYRIKHIYKYYQDTDIVLNQLLYDWSIGGYYDKHKYIVGINGLEFKEDNILLTDEVINNAKERSDVIIEEELRLQEINKKIQENKNNCYNYLNNLFTEFKNNYYTEFDLMPSLICGFKCSGHYYQFTNIENYPIIDFCKVKYIDDKPVCSLIFNINIEDNNIYIIMDYLQLDLKDTIEFNIKQYNFKIKYEEKQKIKLEKLKQELSQFNNKPLYLLFSEDSYKVDSNVRFKMIHDYPDNIIDIAEVILSNLNFIKSKGAKEYILMIPRKRFRESKSGSLLYPYYKVCNHKSYVKDEFEELGLNFVEYKNLGR